MSRRLGISFVEVLIVAAILAILAAIVFSSSAPAREKGRQTVCMSNLQNLYKAIMLYEADGDHSDNQPILGIPYGPFRRPSVLLPYLGGSREVMFCPDLPQAERKGWGSSYNWVLYPVPFGDPNNTMVQRQVQLQQTVIEQQGTSFAIMRCYTHQRKFYENRQSDTDPAFRKQFVIDLTAAGSVKARWKSPKQP